MTNSKLTRRDFLRDTTLYGGGVWIALQLPRPNAARAAAESSQPAVLTPTEWATKIGRASCRERVSLSV